MLALYFTLLYVIRSTVLNDSLFEVNELYTYGSGVHDVLPFLLF